MASRGESSTVGSSFFVAALTLARHRASMFASVALIQVSPVSASTLTSTPAGGSAPLGHLSHSPPTSGSNARAHEASRIRDWPRGS
eukprot:CAMPEP_0206845260 /NCGR_PEP_ID=MMETSP0975-20121206/24397_1 /ASSEMBLY_ACC=CAM_ASM_000399 /TAXON_ID=483370 /ORGANISM="non described non described, Strain CCMP2097" /LENGTH=85 /DNA_ID=CAMNT_0054387839 /DNA_START=282 /DNA_END=539 /DNA_ORIENTATION=-